MDLRSIPRTVVGGYLKVARMPLDAALKLAGRGRASAPAVDRAEAAARDVAGAALGDEELRRDAKLRRTAADEREQAAALRTAAEEREQAAARRREQAAARARAKSERAEHAREQARAAAAETAKARKAATRRRAAASAKAADTRAKRERLAQIETETAALDKREGALNADDEAKRLRAAAERAKAERKS